MEEFQSLLKGIQTRVFSVTNFCYSTEKPLRYHRGDSVVVFQYYNTGICLPSHLSWLRLEAQAREGNGFGV